MLKRRYDQGGVTLKQTHLLLAFQSKLIKMHKPLKKVTLIRNIALFSQLLMMREFEIVFWASLNSEEDINTLIKKNED